MRVLIAGGGIGGLAAALALLRKGIELEVYEQAAALKEVDARLPAEAIQRLNAVLVKALASPEVREGLMRQGLEPAGTSPGEFAKHIASEIDKWATVVKTSGAKID